MNGPDQGLAVLTKVRTSPDEVGHGLAPVVPRVRTKGFRRQVRRTGKDVRALPERHSIVERDGLRLHLQRLRQRSGLGLQIRDGRPKRLNSREQPLERRGQDKVKADAMPWMVYRKPDLVDTLGKLDEKAAARRQIVR